MSEKGQDVWTPLPMHQQHEHMHTHSATYIQINCMSVNLRLFRLTQQGAWAWGRV